MRLSIALILFILLTGCGSDDARLTQDQRNFYERWSSESTTDAQIDAILRNMPRPVADWVAVVTNVREEDKWTIIETARGSHHYYLWIFEPPARQLATEFSKGAEVTFSGDLVQELSLTRSGARREPEFGVYASRVSNGVTLLTQTSEGIRAQHELDRQKAAQANAGAEAQDRDAKLESATISYCQDLVRKKLPYAVGSSFSWFQNRTLKKSDTTWDYTDKVSFIHDDGEKRSVRFVCTVDTGSDELSGSVQFLGDSPE